MTPTGPRRLTPQALAEALSIHTPTQEQAQVILLEDTTELGPYFYIQGMGQFLPKIEAALDGKSKGHKIGRAHV